VDMYKREVTRARQQQTRMIPRLKEIHILRDSWTKLNVSPAKIMQVHNSFYKFVISIYLQQEQVLTELYSYIHQDPPPADVNTVVETHNFLEACNLLFEKGFLSHEKVTSVECNVLQNISKGYQYYTSWLSTLLTEGTSNNIVQCMLSWSFLLDEKFPHTSNMQKSFLSWQSKWIFKLDTMLD